MEKKELELNKKILDYLIAIGISPKLTGFEYLRLAIKLVIKDKSYLSNITKKLYPEISTIMFASPASIERSIRHSVEVACNTKGLLGLNELFGCVIYKGDRKPTNSEIIALIAEKIEMDMRKEAL